VYDKISKNPTCLTKNITFFVISVFAAFMNKMNSMNEIEQMNII